ncbi:MAG: HAMP domain-containing sensor histidine kinase [Chryseolinea sp.]
MATTIAVLSWIWGDSRLFFTQIILVIIIGIEIFELVRFVNHSNREVSRFLDAIKHEDFVVNFKQPKLGKSFTQLQQSMHSIIDTYKDVKIEKEAQYQLLQFLIQRISIGIIFLIEGEIQFINPTAHALLQTQGTKSWKIISEKVPGFANEVAQMGDNGKKLINIRRQSDMGIYALDVSSQIILDKPGKLITIQDINSEIEQKEIEAWHKLIRILTHEIMNSITPISSLTETMQGMLTTKAGNQKHVDEINEETISDILFSLKTINSRSDGLLHFVENYRKLSRVPKPQPSMVVVSNFMDEIKTLFHDNLKRQDIQLKVAYDSSVTAIFDKALLNQVIINLITNSIHALEGRDQKTIHLNAYLDSSKLTFEVTDNGVGIPENELSEIFIPFFSTKKEGSGIGLSLSKQIASLHGGTMKVTSSVGKGTSFYLVIPHRAS